MKDIKIINKIRKYLGKVFSVYEYSINIENETIKRDIVERKDGVVIVPIDENEDKYIEMVKMPLNEAIKKCTTNFNSDITTMAILNYLKLYY